MRAESWLFPVGSPASSTVSGQVWWLTPIIPALGSMRHEDPLRPAVQDQCRQNCKILPIHKIRKLDGHGGLCLWS